MLNYKENKTYGEQFYVSRDVFSYHNKNTNDHSEIAEGTYGFVLYWTKTQELDGRTYVSKGSQNLRYAKREEVVTQEPTIPTKFRVLAVIFFIFALIEAIWLGLVYVKYVPKKPVEK